MSGVSAIATAPLETTAAAFPPVRRREIFGWCCFDFANSAFTTVIISIMFLEHFKRTVAAGDPNALGWWSTALAGSQVVVILISPLIGAIADLTARKKAFLIATAVVCSIATAALFFAGAGDVWYALLIVAFAHLPSSLCCN